MALDFPASPVTGQVYAAEGATFVWSGAVWAVLGASNFTYATQAEAIAGLRADVAMSPLRTKEAIPAGDGGSYFSADPVFPVRAAGVIYQNTSGRPMLLDVWVQYAATGEEMTLLTGPASPPATQIVRDDAASTSIHQRGIVIVPAGWFYALSVRTGQTIRGWWEYT